MISFAAPVDAERVDVARGDQDRGELVGEIERGNDNRRRDRPHPARDGQARRRDADRFARDPGPAADRESGRREVNGLPIVRPKAP